MKKKSFAIVIALFAIITFVKSQSKQINTVQNKSISETTIYQLFPTQNYWTFIKLDTRNGKLWQVHFTIKEDGGKGELVVNPLSLVSQEKEVKGRFTLYPTENMYNFLLLDQIDGNVYQMQWSMEENNRGVFPIK